MNFLSSFDNFSDSEEGGILFLQIAAIFGMKKKKKLMRAKQKIAYQQFNKK